MNKLRDLKADLKLCNKATLGPWQSNKSCGDNHYPNNYVWGEKGPGYGTVAKAGVDYPSIPREHDAEFIAQAREGWPYAINQALAEKERADFLESEVEEYSEKYLSLYRDFVAEKERANKYKALVRERENQIDILSTTLAMYCSPYYDMQERAEKAEALVRELVKLLERIKYLSEEGFMIDETDDYALEQMINKVKESLEAE